MMTDHDRVIDEIKVDTFERFLLGARRVWIIEENPLGDFTVHSWSGPEGKHGAGVAPAAAYPTLRKAAARLLQLLETGPVAPQTWPEDVCIGTVTIESGEEKSAAEALADRTP